MFYNPDDVPDNEKKAPANQSSDVPRCLCHAFFLLPKVLMQQNWYGNRTSC